MRGTIIIALAAASSTAAGCFGSDNSHQLDSLSAALAAGSSIGHASSLTVGSMSSGGVVCASHTPACSTYPCNASTSLTLGPGCPLPLGGNGSGTVIVTAVWSSDGEGTLNETFVGDGVADGKIALSQAEGVSVKTPASGATTGNDITVAYIGQSVSVTGTQTLAAQSAWVVTVDDKGTSDPSDDVYTITGSVQGASTSSDGQLAVTNAVLDPSCRKNPISGMATIQQVNATAGLGAIEVNVVTFHAACDGKADVVGTLGGKSSAPLNFFSN
jgi:hypothetical protein